MFFFYLILLVVARFFPLKLLTAGDIAARGGSFGGRTLAADAPLFFGMKFCVVFVIAALFAPLLADPDALRMPKFYDVLAIYAFGG